MSSARILIVEQESTIARLESAILRMSGFDTVIALDGRDALGRLDDGGFDVVLLGSPVAVDRDRILLEEIVERFPAILPRTIVVTARVRDPRVLFGAVHAGVFAVVAKPFDVDALSKAVSDCIASRGSRGPTRWIGLDPPVAIPLDDSPPPKSVQ